MYPEMLCDVAEVTKPGQHLELFSGCGGGGCYKSLNKMCIAEHVIDKY